MHNAFFSGNIDVTEIVLTSFVLFFVGLILYLRREDRREGYPLETGKPERIQPQGFPPVPSPKEYLLQYGAIRVLPDGVKDPVHLNAEPVGVWPGAPLQPTGDPMLGAIGPGSYVLRRDIPDVTFHGTPKIVPLRILPGWSVATQDPDPRGMDVVGADGHIGGVVRDLWVDQADYLFRYLEVEVTGAKRVLVPINFTRISGRQRLVKVRSILGSHLADAPGVKNPDQITFLEEDRIVGYFGGGTLFATPERLEPLV